MLNLGILLTIILGGAGQSGCWHSANAASQASFAHPTVPPRSSPAE